MCLNPKLIISPLWKRMSSYSSATYIDNVLLPTSSPITNYDVAVRLSSAVSGLHTSSDGHILDSSEVVQKALDGCYGLVFGRRIPIFFAAPCGKCLDCAGAKRSQLAKRSLFEASDYPEMYFFTLTYDDLHLPESGLQRKHCASAFKRLRIQVDRMLNVSEIIGNRAPISIRIFYCGEYGTNKMYTQRPHYHGIFYFSRYLTPFEALRFRQIFYHQVSLFQNSSVGDWWPYGYILDLQKCRNPFACANYITKYMTKQRFNPAPAGKNPTFIQGPSQNGGYGCSHMDRYSADILRSPDFTIRLSVNGHTAKTCAPAYMLRKIFNTDLSRLLPGYVYAYDFVKLALFNLEETAYIRDFEKFYILDFLERYKHCGISFHPVFRKWHSFFKKYIANTGPSVLLDHVNYIINYFDSSPLFPDFTQYVARLAFKDEQFSKLACSSSYLNLRANKQYVHEQYALLTPEPIGALV